MSASESLAHKYADIFVALFNHIPAAPQDPFITPLPYPQQNISGHVYAGRNGFVTSLVASKQHYEFPIWLTFKQIKEAGLSVRQGEHSVPIAVYNYYLYDKITGKKSDITEDEFKLMTSEQKARYEIRCFLRPPWHVFNLSQTNFKEVMPERYEELSRLINGPKEREVTETLIDEVVSNDSWQCPVRVNSNILQPYYSVEKDIIVTPPKEAFIDNSAYYSSLLYMMAQSTYHPNRNDKVVSESMQRLSSQLSSAMLCSLLGINSRIDHDNLSYLKKWSSEISSDPMIIYKAVNDASRLSDIISRNLGIGVKKGIDLSGVFKEADVALTEAKERQTKNADHKVTPKLKR